jgi:hypothetical protein
VNSSNRCGLDLSNPALLCDCDGISLLYGFLDALNCAQLVSQYASLLWRGNELLNLDGLGELVQGLLQEPLLVVDLQLIFELGTPVMLLIEGVHGIEEGVAQVALG